MSVEALVVPAFKGIHRPGLTGRITTRRVLDEPREIYNFHLTDDGHLYMPAAPNLVHDFSADGDIQTIHYLENPRGIIIQMSNGKIYHYRLLAPTNEPPVPAEITLLATIDPAETEWNIWVLDAGSYGLMGYCPRGSAGAGPDGDMWKIAGTPPTATSLRSTVGRASYSTLFKGRRFWVTRGRQVWFSPLNQYDQPAEDNFTIGGDDGGNGYEDNPGFVQGMIGWEDVLVFFLTGSVWILTGGGPETWNLRQVQTMAGNSSSWTLMRTDDGVLTYGGGNLNDPGLYLFTGNNAVKISDVVDDYMRSIGHATATICGGRYVLGTSRAGADNRQFLLYQLKTKQWTAFDGFVKGTAAVMARRLYINGGGILYRIDQEIFPRAPGRGARITLGYQDDENPSGLVRYLGVKLAGRKWGTGVPTVTVTATTPDGSVTSAPQNIGTDVFDNIVVPVNVRGAGVELTLEFTPAADDNELLIENVQVILSRKGEKVSRA